MEHHIFHSKTKSPTKTDPHSFAIGRLDLSRKNRLKGQRQVTLIKGTIHCEEGDWLM